MAKRRTGRRMVLITVHLTEQQLRELDRLVQMKIFPNRSEAIRVAIMYLISQYGFGQGRINMAGLVTGL